MIDLWWEQMKTQDHHIMWHGQTEAISCNIIRRIIIIIGGLCIWVWGCFAFYHVLSSVLPTPWTHMVLDVLSCYLIWLYLTVPSWGYVQFLESLMSAGCRYYGSLVFFQHTSWWIWKVLFERELNFCSKLTSFHSQTWLLLLGLSGKMFSLWISIGMLFYTNLVFSIIMVYIF